MKFTMGLRYKIIKPLLGYYLSPNKNVCDIGTGNGFIADCIKRDFNVNIETADIVNLSKLNVKFTLVEQGKRLPFKNRQFDYILLIDVLHHCTNKEQVKVIKEAKRCAEKVIIIEAEPALTVFAIDYLINKIHYKNSIKIPLNFKKIEVWQSKLKSLGIAPAHIFKYPYWHLVKYFAILL